MSNEALKEVAKAALEGIQSQAEALAYETGNAVADALKQASKNAMGLLEAAVKGDISSDELKGALNEIQKTIEGVIAGEAFDAQRDVLEMLKNTALEYLPKVLTLV
jgi:hypothetical protein